MHIIFTFPIDGLYNSKCWQRASGVITGGTSIPDGALPALSRFVAPPAAGSRRGAPCVEKQKWNKKLPFCLLMVGACVPAFDHRTVNVLGKETKTRRFWIQTDLKCAEILSSALGCWDSAPKRLDILLTWCKSCWACRFIFLRQEFRDTYWSRLVKVEVGAPVLCSHVPQSTPKVDRKVVNILASSFVVFFVRPKTCLLNTWCSQRKAKQFLCWGLINLLAGSVYTNIRMVHIIPPWNSHGKSLGIVAYFYHYFNICRTCNGRFCKAKRNKKSPVK